MTQPFTAQSIGKSFGSVDVLKGVILWGRAGAITALLGRNGSGKTTLIKCALGLVRADCGTLQVGGLTFERPAPPLAWLGWVCSTYQNATCYRWPIPLRPT